MNRTTRWLVAFCMASPSLAFAELVATELWATDAVFKNPESAIYDMERNVLYISNVDGDGLAKDGHGFISRMTPDGQITDLEWVTGLNGPKGMAIVDSRLYVADIDRVVEIDISTGTVIHRYEAPGAQFLNDVTADTAGNVYISDMFTNRIHRLRNGTLEAWMEGSMLENPNGLYAADGKLYVGTWGAIKAGFSTQIPGHIKVINIDDKSVADFGSDKPIGNMDGIVLMADGSMIATDWMAGGLMIVNPEGAVQSLLDLNQGSADLEYISGGSVAIIPMMIDNKVIAYQVAEPPPPLPVPTPTLESGVAAPGAASIPDIVIPGAN